MNTAGRILAMKLAEAVPRAHLFWEEEPQPHHPGLHGAMLTADLNGKKLSMKFERPEERGRDGTGDPVQDLLASLDDIVDDFVSFFQRSIYRKERFTRTVPC